MVRFSIKKFIYFSIIILTLIPLVSSSLNFSFSNLEMNNTSEEIRVSNGNLDLDLSILPDIDYSMLNNLWYNHKIEMLIITPDSSAFVNAIQPLADWKNEKGVKTVILSNYSSYEGVDDADKIRNMIKSYYEKENVRWVLLAGDAGNGKNELPIRYVYNPDVRSVDPPESESIGDNYFKPTDFYYADLTGTWDSDEDEVWGEAPEYNDFGLDEISWIPEVYVGRLPAGNSVELETMVNKTLKYETDPEVDDWMNNMLLAGGISDTFFQEPPDGEDESKLTTYIWQNYVLSEMNFTHLWRSTYYIPPDPKEPLTSTSFIDQFNLGYSTVIFAGHGEYSRYLDQSGTIYTNNDAQNALNTNKPSLVYGDACTTSSYDYNNKSIGEYLIKKKDAGAIGYIGGLRVTWYHLNDDNLEKLNRGNAKLFWKEFFEGKKFQQGRALYDSKVAYINSDYYKGGEGATYKEWERKNLLTYCLLGDPELDIYTNKPKLALNPFTENIYEGQLVSTSIKDINGKNIPYARVHLKSYDGKYYTAYADEHGLVRFRLPAQATEFYNVTITGHNLVPTHFNFTTIPDNYDPQLLRLDVIPEKPSSSNKINFSIETYDNMSGIESVYLVLSKDNFTTYSYYESTNSYEENNDVFTITTDRLTSGEYSYCIVSRDYANNTNVFYNSGFTFSLLKPMIDYIFISFSVMIVAIIGISVFSLFKGLQRYSRVVKEIEKLT